MLSFTKSAVIVTTVVQNCLYYSVCENLFHSSRLIIMICRTWVLYLAGVILGRNDNGVEWMCAAHWIASRYTKLHKASQASRTSSRPKIRISGFFLSPSWSTVILTSNVMNLSNLDPTHLCKLQCFFLCSFWKFFLPVALMRSPRVRTLSSVASSLNHG
jgi:hypothetical protein